MRLLRFPLVLSAILIFACNSNRDKITIKDEKGNKTTIDVKSATAAAELASEANDKTEELKKLSPLTVDQLKALVPDPFMGMKRTRFSAHSQLGYGIVDADYAPEGDDTKKLKVSIYDCAGEAGAGFYTMGYWMWNFAREDDNGYEKTIQFNGGKAIEKYNKYNDEYSIMAFTNDRFLVQVEGEKTGLDFVKEAAKNLNPKVN